jgi:serine/threonine protein kinase
LGSYEIVAPLGAGGMGEVYQARDTRLDRTVAINILPAAVADDPQRRRTPGSAKTIAMTSARMANLSRQHDGQRHVASDRGRPELNGGVEAVRRVSRPSAVPSQFLMKKPRDALTTECITASAQPSDNCDGDHRLTWFSS